MRSRRKLLIYKFCVYLIFVDQIFFFVLERTNSEGNILKIDRSMHRFDFIISRSNLLILHCYKNIRIITFT